MDLRPPEGDASVPELVELIAEEIERSGPMTFARFMELVIGHPEYGYYAASVDRVGPSGDFLTAPETHPLFGVLLARQIAECWSLLGEPAELRIAEDGAGRGTLAEQVLAALNGMSLEGLETVRYVLHDINPDHSAYFERRVDATGSSSGQSERQSAESSTCEIVVANELLDALPFHRLVKAGQGFKELRVDIQQGWFVSQLSEPSDVAEIARVDASKLDDGQFIEVAPGVADWVRRLAERLERGFAVIFDYGYERDVLHDPVRFPKGTLKTYRRHEVGEDPFLDIGQRDITAHVDFTLVQQVAQEAGLTVEGLTSLAEFSAGLGLDEILLEIQSEAESPEVYLAARTAAMELLNPTGLGRFRVAILSKGVTFDGPLRGLSFKMPGLHRS